MQIHRVSVIVLFFLGATGGYGQAQDPLRGWHQESNMAAAIHLTAVQEGPSRVGLVFTNVGTRLITSFSVSFGRGTSQNIDYFDSDSAGLAAGSSYTLWRAARSSSQEPAPTLKVSAVVFDDGTGDGVQKEIDCIRVNRLGRMAEALRIAGVLEQTPATYVGGTGLAKLKQVIGSLPESTEEALQSLEGVSLPGVQLLDLRLADKDILPNFLEGVRNTREQMQWKVQALAGLPPSSTDTKADTQQKALAALQRTYQNKVVRFREYCIREQARRAQ